MPLQQESGRFPPERDAHSQKVRLLHRYRDEAREFQANLDDYAFLIWGLIDLYETVFDVRVPEGGSGAERVMLEHFWDNVSGRPVLFPGRRQRMCWCDERRYMMVLFLPETQWPCSTCSGFRTSPGRRNAEEKARALCPSLCQHWHRPAPGPHHAHVRPGFRPRTIL